MSCYCNGTDKDCFYKTAAYSPYFRLGQVVITEGQRSDWISKAIAAATGSWFTHCFIVTGPNELTEAWFPWVRKHSLIDRVKELHREKRAYAVLDLPGITAAQRCDVAREAHKFVGRWYDVGQALLYAAFKRFFGDGTGTVICSRHVSASFRNANHELFDVATVSRKFGTNHPRFSNIINDEIIPTDLFKSRLRVVRWKPSSKMRTWK